MAAYYNEIEPYAAQWLRNLIAAGHIAPGDVDERSIEDVRPGDLRGYTQCHFFAGIGVWSYALRRAGWPDDRPVWTGSCPCQPFSVAGAGGGFDDERHLWPAWHWLIGERRPPVILGEQVASKAVGPWIDLVFTDLETMGYACGAVAFPSAGVGAPHIRDRAFFVAHADDGRWRAWQRDIRARKSHDAWRGTNGIVADTHGRQRDGIARPGLGCDGDASGGCAGPTNGFWRDADWLLCRDGKWRPVEPGTSPLAHGATARVGRLRAYGNCINAEAAQAFIEAYLETTE